MAFRERLGGFYKAELIGETYGLPDSTFQRILPSLQESPLFRQIPVNTVDEKTLSSHPYITSAQARLIVRYRHQHGDFRQAQDLYQIKILDSLFVERAGPYFDFSPSERQ